MLDSDDPPTPLPGTPVPPNPVPIPTRKPLLATEPVAQLDADAPIQQRIIECAGVIFAERGYRDATVRDIAAAANVNLAGISYHFGGKQQLYLATIDSARKSRADFAALAAVAPTHIPADQRLRVFIRAMLNRLLDRSERDWRSRLLARELTSPTDFCFEQISQWYRPIFEALLRMVEEVLGHPLEEPRRTLVGFSIVGQCLFYRVSSEAVKFFVPPERRAIFADQLDVAALADHICDFSLRGLAGRGRSQQEVGVIPKSPGDS